MQMSATRVFVFVEGQEMDGFFYGEVCRPVCAAANKSYEIVRADRLAEGGGKQTLIALHGFLESVGSLVERRKTGSSTCIFFLDKDVDDILGTKIISPHVVYTQFYNVENYLFLYGDIVKASAAASSFDAARISLRVPDSLAWLRLVSERWKEFVVLCLFSRKHGVNCDCTYRRRASPLNTPADTPTDAQAVAQRKSALMAAMGLGTDKFERKFRASIRMVELLYRRDRQELLFNGKWYVELISREIELAAGGEAYSRHGLANGLRAALAATLNFNAPWVEHLRMPLRRLIETM